MQEVVYHSTHPDHNTVLEGLTSFGVDPLGPSLNPFERGSVQVPEVNLSLSAGQMHTIQIHLIP